MTKTIMIADKAVEFKTSAALPILYRNIIGADFFKDIEKITENGDAEIMQNIAYVAYRHGNKEDKSSIEEWLEGFNLIDFINSLQEIVEFVMSDQKQTSEVKKN